MRDASHEHLHAEEVCAADLVGLDLSEEIICSSTTMLRNC